MFDLLVVDDDGLGRKGILSSICREELNIDQVFEAGDGEEAMAVLEREPTVGMVLTDIKMPKMDGIALIREAKARWPQLPMVIISGYDDFAFLRQAIRYGVNDYLLKPIDPVELQDVLLAITEKMTMKTKLRTEGEEQLRSYTLYRLVEGTIGWTELRPKMQMLHMELGSGPYVAAEVLLPAGTREAELSRLAKALDRWLQTQQQGMAFLHPARRLICLLNGLGSFEEKKALLLQGVEKTVEHENVGLRFGWEVEDVESIPFSFQALTQETPQPQPHLSPLIRDVRDYIDGHCCEDLSLKELSERFYISAAYLGSMFKKEVGCQFTDYVNQKRVDQAEKLLRTTNLRVYEIVEQVGFKDKNYFMRIFKKYTGMTPTKLRK